jgi:hypothetical protein
LGVVVAAVRLDISSTYRLRLGGIVDAGFRAVRRPQPVTRSAGDYRKLAESCF